MTGNRFSLFRFFALAGFIVVVAVGLWLLAPEWYLIVATMTLATLIAWTIEWLAWREAQNRWAVVERDVGPPERRGYVTRVPNATAVEETLAAPSPRLEHAEPPSRVPPDPVVPAPEPAASGPLPAYEEREAPQGPVPRRPEDGVVAAPDADVAAAPPSWPSRIRSALARPERAPAEPEDAASAEGGAELELEPPAFGGPLPAADEAAPSLDEAVEEATPEPAPVAPRPPDVEPEPVPETTQPPAAAPDVGETPAAPEPRTRSSWSRWARRSDPPPAPEPVAAQETDADPEPEPEPEPVPFAQAPEPEPAPREPAEAPEVEPAPAPTDAAPGVTAGPDAGPTTPPTPVSTPPPLPARPPIGAVPTPSSPTARSTPPEPPAREAATPAPPRAPVVRLPIPSAEPREWNVWELEAVAREASRRAPERSAEWSYLLLHLREYADPGGTLPREFDAVVRESFDGFLERIERP